MTLAAQGEWNLGLNRAYDVKTGIGFVQAARVQPKPPTRWPRVVSEMAGDDSAELVPFWRRKSLADMTDSEWESLCDGCGRCCLNKLEEEETDRTFYTDVGCRLLDGKSCRCRDYAHRLEKVEDCVQLTPENLKTITWLPPSCAYVLLAQGKDLYWWHPLVSGDPDTVHAAGVSVRGRVYANEKDVSDDMLEDYIVSWPLKLPKRARRR
jgi:uncharacterized cysteine cluster protein YcgN (CxxCxxCC family)